MYNELIMEHYENPDRYGNCPKLTHVHCDNNPLCGDQICIQLRINENKIEDAWFNGDGCVISLASASMLVKKIIGLTTEEIQSFTATDMLNMFGCKLTSSRQKCCLLAWRAVRVAVFSPSP